MKRIIIAAFCLLILASCASLSATNTKNRRIAEAAYQEGKAYYSQQKYSIALGKFLEAEKTISNDYFLQYDIGIIYYLKEKYDLAEIHFKKALELKPDFMPAMNGIGVLYIEQKQWDKAIERFENCLNSLLYATPHFALTNLGWAYIGKKNYELAKNNFLKALKIKPNYSRALHGFVTVSLKTNNEQSAIKLLVKALKKEPNSMIIHYDFAKIYEKLGQDLKAKEHWAKVIDFAPEGSKFIEEAVEAINKK
jgi:type IV pilus assembly protein PilF